MTVTGHPDDQTYANWRGPDFLANATFPLSVANPAVAQGNVTNFASTYVFVDGAPAGGAQVAVQFFTDDTRTIQTAGYGWVIPSGYFLSVTVPNTGNFVRVTVSTPTVAATSIPIVILPTNTNVEKPAYNNPLMSVSNGGVSVPASGNVRFIFPQVAAGSYHLQFRDVGSSTHLGVQVNVANEDGSNGNLVYLGPAPQTALNDNFYMDAEPLVLQVNNSDTVAHSAQFMLACNP